MINTLFRERKRFILSTRLEKNYLNVQPAVIVTVSHYTLYWVPSSYSKQVSK